jgi:hypothetical protein
VTAALPDSTRTPLPLWRLISGLAVLGTLIALLILAAFVYLNDYRLDRYMRSLAEQPSSAQLSDADLSSRLLDRAKQLGLTVHPYDIGITRSDGRIHIRIDKFTVQTKLVRLDLRLPAAQSR